MRILDLFFLIVITAFTGCRTPEDVIPKAPQNNNQNLCGTLPVSIQQNPTNQVNTESGNGITVGGCVITDSIKFGDHVILLPDSSTYQQPPMIPVGGIIIGTNNDTGGTDPFPGTTNCIEQQINLFSHSHFICVGATVTEVTFQGQSVFVFYPGPCGVDVAMSVLDLNCDQIGTLGGIANTRQINGIDFYSNSVLANTLWTK